MGKYALLITIAAALGVSYYSQQSLSTSQDTSRDLSERQRTVIARQIARSAFNNAVSKVKTEWCNVPAGIELTSYEKGEYEVTFSSSSTGGGEGEDGGGEDSCAGKSITVTVTGYYPGKDPPNKVSYRIEGTAEQRTMVSGLFSGLTASGALSKLRVNGCGGGGCTSGVPPGGGEGRSGMSLPASMEEHINDEGCPENGWEQGDIVAGEGSAVNECGVQVRDASAEGWVQSKMNAIKSEITSEENTSDVTVCGSGGNGTGPPDDKETGPPDDKDTGPPNNRGPFAFASMSVETGSSGGGPPGDCALDGEGILLVPDGKTATANGGPPRWDGLVYVEDGGGVTINGGGNTQSINGGLLMEGGSSFLMNGGERVQYDPNELSKYEDLLPSIKTTEVTVTDRTSKFVQANE